MGQEVIVQPRPPAELDVYSDTEKFELAERVANKIAECTLIPPHFRKNPANCFVAMQLCRRLNEDPFMIMQKMYVVNDRLGIESQLAIAMMNKSGVFSTRIKYRENGKTGDGYGWIAYANDAKTGEECAEECTIEIAKKKGWWAKSGSNWPAMTDLMLKYRAAMFLGRLHCPGALMGMTTIEELKDLGEAEILDGTPSTRLSAAELDAAISVEPEPVKEPETAKPRKSKQAAAEPAPAAVEEPKSEVLQVEGETEEEILASFKSLPADAKARFKAIAKAEKESGNYLLADGTTIDEAAIFVAAKNLFNAQEAFK